MTARELQLDPCGSAGAAAGFLLLGAPLPWPRDAKEIGGFDDVLAEARRRDLRVQAVAGDGVDPGAVVRYVADGGGYRSDAGARHVLVCTHGSRDRCCGAEGTRLYTALRRRWDRPDLLWRTSHLGGHRFAPTALILPEGTMWGFLDPSVLEGIVGRTIAPGRAARHYRGSARIDAAAVQVADRCAFERLGWSWLDEDRHGEAHPEGDGVVVASVQSREHRILVRLAQHRMVPVISCGSSIDAASLEPQYRVLEVTSE